MTDPQAARSKTPRTDALLARFDVSELRSGDAGALRDLARTLERELADANLLVGKYIDLAAKHSRDAAIAQARVSRLVAPLTQQEAMKFRATWRENWPDGVTCLQAAHAALMQSRSDSAVTEGEV